MRTRHFADSQSLWRHATRSPGTTIIVSSAQLRDHLQSQRALMQRVVTVAEFMEMAGAQAALGPSALSAQLTRHLRDDMGPLGQIAHDPAAVEHLARYLCELDRHQRSHAGEQPLDVAVRDLREELEQDGIVSRDQAWHAVRARQVPGCGEIVVCADRPHPALTKLLEGLEHPVELLRLEDEAPERIEALAVAERVQGSVEAVRSLIDSHGASAVALIAPGEMHRPLLREAVRAGVGLRAQLVVDARDSIIGSLLLMAARGASVSELLVHGGPSGLTAADLELLDGSAKALHELGMRLRERTSCEADELAGPWLDQLHMRLSEQLPALHLLESTRCEVAVGHPDGALLISWAQAPGWPFEAIVCTGLDASSMPPAAPVAPFGTVGLREDWDGIFARALRSASRRVLVAQRGETPCRMWTAHVPESTHVPASAPQAAASVRERLADGWLAVDRTRFSVTELELFLSCPYGWFVRHVLAPVPGKADPRALRGHALHEACATLLQLPVHERSASLSELWRTEANEQLFGSSLRVYERRLHALIERYASGAWPWSEHMCEVPLQASLIASMPEVTITGRADRIDRGGPGLLVIDYKNRRALRRPAESAQVTSLQETLYPLMAERALGEDALGMVYVSIYHGDHAGVAASHVEHLDNGKVAFGPLQARQQLALDAVAQAIEQIRAGEVTRVGDSCPSWCPHRLISETPG
jgi:RecB family exonuclease